MEPDPKKSRFLALGSTDWLVQIAYPGVTKKRTRRGVLVARGTSSTAIEQPLTGFYDDNFA